MSRMATEEEFEEYSDSGLCPYCYAEDIVKDKTEWKGKTLRQSLYCTKCEKRWTEIYTMTGLFLDDAED
ncbi:MAG: hypothetical protein JRI95_08055 [Deltaproteobacteria bacterium]|nr:hypothetical protein [Deltaproteobacteria bacterium]